MSNKELSPAIVSRRDWLRQSACGFGYLSLAGLAALDARVGLAGRTHFPAKARRVIFLFLHGGVSHIDTFDPKPALARYDGKPVPIKKPKVTFAATGNVLKSPWEFSHYGECGLPVSSLFPKVAAHIDDLCVIRSLKSDFVSHGGATLQLHTGDGNLTRPSLGSWLMYGLGTENEDLPSFITVHPPGDPRVYGSSFLPAMHQGTPLRVPGNENESAIADLRDPHGKPEAQRRRLDFLQGMNQRLLKRVKTDSQMEGIIESFELAFRMQAKTPGLVDLSGETQETQQLYGIGDGPSDRNGRACLMARRLSEAGVRFVQVTMGGWDPHGDIHAALRGSCAGADRPIGGLISDLKRRGLLEDTLVMVSGEFGRTYWSQDLSGKSPIIKHGREHQQESFCTLLAGGGVKPGFVHGETDDHGYRPVQGRVHLHDLHATMLHLLGIDHERLTYPHHGRDYRLTDVFGEVVKEILA